MSSAQKMFEQIDVSILKKYISQKIILLSINYDNKNGERVIVKIITEEKKEQKLYIKEKVLTFCNISKNVVKISEQCKNFVVEDVTNEYKSNPEIQKTENLIIYTSKGYLSNDKESLRSVDIKKPMLKLHFIFKTNTVNILEYLKNNT